MSIKGAIYKVRNEGHTKERSWHQSRIEERLSYQSVPQLG
jgi:hypothetical protein